MSEHNVFKSSSLKLEAWRQLLMRLLMAVRATPLQSHSQITVLFRLEKMLCN